MQSYCVARGILISPIIDQKKAAIEYLKEWAMIANSNVVWSEGVMKFICLADESFTGEYGSYTPPNNTIQKTFSDDNISSPIKPTRKNPADCYNRLQVECSDRANDYNKYTTATIDDMVSITEDGVRNASNIVIDSVCLPNVAMIVGYTELLKGLYIRNTYEITPILIDEIDRLEPLDFVNLLDVALNPSAFRVRILAVEHEESGKITITAEEAPEGIYNG
jgi:hypothetical protein